jgi:hypothetical protein
MKYWTEYYAKLIASSALNGFIMWLYVATGAGVAQSVGVIDLRALYGKGVAWTLLATVVTSIAGALYRNQIPEPTKK